MFCPVTLSAHVQMSSGRNEVKINDFFKTSSQHYHCQPSHRRRKDYICLVGMIKKQKEIQYNRPQVLLGPPLVILLTEHGIYEDL